MTFILPTWQSYSPSFTLVAGGAANGTPVGRYRYFGDTLQVRVAVTITGGIASESQVSIPTGFTPDFTKMPNVPSVPYGNQNTALVGYGWVADATANQRYGLQVGFRNNGNTLRYFQYLGSFLSTTLAANDVIFLNAEFPVTVP